MKCENCGMEFEPFEHDERKDIHTDHGVMHLCPRCNAMLIKMIEEDRAEDFRREVEDDVSDLIGYGDEDEEADNETD